MQTLGPARSVTRLFLSLLLLSVCFRSTEASAMQTLVDELCGADDAARVRARQLLPSFGVDAIPALIPHLSDQQSAAAKATFEVMWDIVNQASAPGQDAQRLRATDMLIPLVSPAKSEVEKIQGLRLLAITVPDGYDVAPIAALLSDSMLREKARTTLERIATDEAATALIAALSTADPEFAASLLRSLAEIKSPDALPPAQALAQHADPAVRVAAAHLLAQTGNPAYVSLLQSISDKATPDTKFETQDVLLQLGDALLREGGNWQCAISLYSNVLEETDYDVLKSAALMGLGRHGDESVVDLLIRYLDDGDHRLQSTAKVALASLPGEGPSKTIAARYPTLSRQNQLMLLNVFTQRKDASAVPLLIEAASSADVEFRIAGLIALGEIGVADGLPILAAALQSGSDAEKQVAAEAIEFVAKSLDSTVGDKTATGNAFAQIYQISANDAIDAATRAAVQERALNGLQRFPVADGFDVAMAAIDTAEQRDKAIPTLIAIGGALLATGDHARALQAYERIGAVSSNAQELRAIAPALEGLGSKVDVFQKLGFVTNWRVVGPFDWDSGKAWDTSLVAEPHVDLAAHYAGVTGDIHWNKVKSADGSGKIDLRHSVADRDLCLAYAHAEIAVDVEQDAVMVLGADDGVRIWLNGRLAYENLRNGPLIYDEWNVAVHLMPGVNTILMKISQNNLGWEFAMRLAKPDATPLTIRQASE